MQKIHYIEPRSQDEYSDGSVEDDILKIFESEGSEQMVGEILSGDPNWPMRYHLSPVRQNILNWYEFGK